MNQRKTLTLTDKVLLCDGDKCRLVSLNDVRYFETCGNYTRTHFNDGKLLIYRTLTHLESRLSEQSFFRANRQQIINLSHVKDIEMLHDGSFRVEMSCGKMIELSRRRSQLFKCAMSL